MKAFWFSLLGQTSCLACYAFSGFSGSPLSIVVLLGSISGLRQVLPVLTVPQLNPHSRPHGTFNIQYNRQISLTGIFDTHPIILKRLFPFPRPCFISQSQIEVLSIQVCLHLFLVILSKSTPHHRPKRNRKGPPIYLSCYEPLSRHTTFLMTFSSPRDLLRSQ